MRIDDLPPLLTTVAGPRATSVLNAWRVGQVIEALVTRVPSVGTVTLNVNNTPIDVRTTLPLEVGTRLLLEVAQTGKQAALRVISTPTAQETIASAVRSLAPRQGSLQPVLEQLLRWADTAPTTPTSKAPASTPAPFMLPPAPLPMRITSSQLNSLPLTQLPLQLPSPSLPTRLFGVPVPPPLLELAQRVVQRVATPQQIASPEGLKQAIKDSGAFFEHKLASPAARSSTEAPINRDLKAVLLQLISALKTATPTVTQPVPHSPGVAPLASPPPATHRSAPAHQAAAMIEIEAQLQMLVKDTEAAVARVTLQQLLSLPEKNADAPQWIFDLPVRWGEWISVFHLHVYREKHSRDPRHSPAWCVRLTFDLVTLGEVGVLVTLLAGAVNVSIWARQPATADLFGQHLDALQTQLHNAGVAVNQVSCECGAAPFSAETPLAQKQRHLIDERV